MWHELQPLSVKAFLPAAEAAPPPPPDGGGVVVTGGADAVTEFFGLPAT